MRNALLSLASLFSNTVSLSEVDLWAHEHKDPGLWIS